MIGINAIHSLDLPGGYRLPAYDVAFNIGEMAGDYPVGEQFTLERHMALLTYLVVRRTLAGVIYCRLVSEEYVDLGPDPDQDPGYRPERM